MTERLTDILTTYINVHTSRIGSPFSDERLELCRLLLFEKDVPNRLAKALRLLDDDLFARVNNVGTTVTHIEYIDFIMVVNRVSFYDAKILYIKKLNNMLSEVLNIVDKSENND